MRSDAPGWQDVRNTCLTCSSQGRAAFSSFACSSLPSSIRHCDRLLLSAVHSYAYKLGRLNLPCCSYYDGEMRPLLSRHTRKRSNSGIDERAGMLPLVLPSPGDPSRT